MTATATRTFLIVAHNKTQAEVVGRRLPPLSATGLTRRVIVEIATTTYRPLLDGLLFDEVVWVDGWRLGPRAGHVERWIRRAMAKRRRHVVERDATP